MEIVTAWEEVSNQFLVVCRRVRRRRGGCRGSSFRAILLIVEASARGGVGGINVAKVTKADDASLCH